MSPPLKKAKPKKIEDRTTSKIQPQLQNADPSAQIDKLTTSALSAGAKEFVQDPIELKEIEWRERVTYSGFVRKTVNENFTKDSTVKTTLTNSTADSEPCDCENSDEDSIDDEENSNDRIPTVELINIPNPDLNPYRAFSSAADLARVGEYVGRSDLVSTFDRRIFYFSRQISSFKIIRKKLQWNFFSGFEPFDDVEEVFKNGNVFFKETCFVYSERKWEMEKNNISIEDSKAESSEIAENTGNNIKRDPNTAVWGLFEYSYFWEAPWATNLTDWDKIYLERTIHFKVQNSYL